MEKQLRKIGFKLCLTEETAQTSECGKSLMRIEQTGSFVIPSKACSVNLATVDGRRCFIGS